MVVNPFVRLFEAPVETLILAAYVCALLTLLIVTLGAVYRNGLTLYIRFKRQRPQQWEYVPPVGFLLRLAAIPFVIGLDLLFVAAVIELLT